MPSIATTISKRVFRNVFVKEVILVPGKVLDRLIVDSLLLVYLQILDILLGPSIDLRFSIVILFILPTFQPTDYIYCQSKNEISSLNEERWRWNEFVCRIRFVVSNNAIIVYTTRVSNNAKLEWFIIYTTRSGLLHVSHTMLCMSPML